MQKKKPHNYFWSRFNRVISCFVKNLNDFPTAAKQKCSLPGDDRLNKDATCMGEERIWSLASQITEEEGISGYCYPEGFRHSGKTTYHDKQLTYALKIRVQSHARCHFPKQWVSMSLWFSYSARIPWKLTDKKPTTNPWEGLVSWCRKIEGRKTKTHFWENWLLAA